MVTVEDWNDYYTVSARAVGGNEWTARNAWSAAYYITLLVVGNSLRLVRAAGREKTA